METTQQPAGIAYANFLNEEKRKQRIDFVSQFGEFLKEEERIIIIHLEQKTPPNTEEKGDEITQYLEIVKRLQNRIPSDQHENFKKAFQLEYLAPK